MLFAVAGLGQAVLGIWQISDGDEGVGWTRFIIGLIMVVAGLLAARPSGCPRQ